MPNKYHPIPGERYGRYTVIKEAPAGIHKETRVLCKCDCGNEKVVKYSSLISGAIVSCGCYGIEMRAKALKQKRKHNDYYIRNCTVYMIPTNRHNNDQILFDEIDLPLLKQFTWRVNKTGYVIDTANKNIRMHRLIMNCADSNVVDHINGNPLDNRRCNLRICYQSDNCINKVANHKKLHSKYKGVFSATNGRTYFSTIQCHGKQYYLGSYASEIEAALAYDAAAKEMFGEYAKLNFQ